VHLQVSCRLVLVLQTVEPVQTAGGGVCCKALCVASACLQICTQIINSRVQYQRMQISKCVCVCTGTVASVRASVKPCDLSCMCWPLLQPPSTHWGE